MRQRHDNFIAYLDSPFSNLEKWHVISIEYLNINEPALHPI